MTSSVIFEKPPYPFRRVRAVLKQKTSARYPNDIPTASYRHACFDIYNADSLQGVPAHIDRWMRIASRGKS
jgi:hypothetical protein